MAAPAVAAGRKGKRKAKALAASPAPAVSKAHERVVRARSHMVLDRPFFGLLATRLKLLEDPTCGTFWTDGVSLGFNPTHVDELNDLELLGSLAHIVLHLVSGHPWRQDHRESERWNRACDEVLNHLAIDDGFVLSANETPDPAFRNLAAEAVYELLPPTPEDEGGARGGEAGGDSGEGPSGADAQKDAGEEQQEGEGDSGFEQASAGQGPAADGDGQGESPPEDDPSGNGSGSADAAADGDGSGSDGPSGSSPPAKHTGPGEVRPAPKGSEGRLEQEWQQAIINASRAQGVLPAGLDRLVEEALESTQDWRELLRALLESSFAAPDYVWTRPNKRYQHLDLYMPSLQGEGLKCVVIARDTSASMADHYLAKINGEIELILGELQPDEVIVLDIDACVHQVQRLETPYDIGDFERKAKGGGGTSFVPAFEWIEENGIDATCLIYLTDLGGTFPTEEPSYPVFWVHPEGYPTDYVPFGDTVELT